MFVLSSLHQAFKCRVCGKTFFNRKCLLNHLVQCQQASGAQDKTLGFGVCHFIPCIHVSIVGVLLCKLHCRNFLHFVHREDFNRTN